MCCMKPPVARHQRTERTFHGHTFVDDFEWLREKSNPEVIDFLTRHNEYVDHVLGDQEELRRQLVAEVMSRINENETSHAHQVRGWWYYWRSHEGKNYRSHHRVRSETRPDPSTPIDGEQLLFDENVMAEGQDFFSATGYVVSPDNRYLAVGTDVAGDERYTLSIIDIETGEVIDRAVTETGYSFGWTRDSAHVYYTKADEAWRSYQVWIHEVGTDQDSDELLYEDPDEKYWVTMDVSRDGRWLVIHTGSRTTTEVRIQETVPGSEQIVVSERRPGLDYSVEVADDHLLILHNLNNVDFEVSTAPIGASLPEEWESVLRAEEGERISLVSAFSTFAVVELRSGGYTQVRVLDRTETGYGPGRVVPSPPMSTVYEVTNKEWEASTITLHQTSLLDPVSIYAYTPATNGLELVKVTDTPNYDRSRYSQVQVWATAGDGTKIPMTLAHRADLSPDGTNPVLLYGYGSYEVSSDPWFNPQRISLLDRGVVYAIAHIRGGGEMGRAWYDNGKMLSKKNTFTDFVDCADHLVESGWAAPRRIVASGGSAGGLLMGAVVNMAPEKFAGIDAVVPFVDALTTILNPALPLTVGEWEEWGDPYHDPNVYEYMRGYSPYENIRKSEYPPILATTSLNDTRVFYVEPAKWIAKLTEEATGGPFLLKTEMVAGHGGRSGRYNVFYDVAIRHAFTLNVLDVDSVTPLKE